MNRNTKLLLGGVAVAAGIAIAAREVDARWAAADDPCAEDDLRLPDGHEQTVRTDDGAELAVSVAGEGPTVVLPHCWGGGREIWAPVAHRLIRSGHRVVLYDQRGHGSSTVGEEGFAIPRLGADLRAVLEAVDARDAVLAGHSMGGMTVQSLATHHPSVVAERANAIVLVSTAASGLGRHAVADAIAQRVIGSGGLTRLLSSRVGHAFVRGAVGKSVRRNHLVVTRDLFAACPSEARSGLLAAMQTMDLREGIAEIGLPTTVVIGSRDRLTPPDRAAELAETIPQARLVELRGYGHMLPLEAPDEVATAIREAARAHAMSA